MNSKKKLPASKQRVTSKSSALLAMLRRSLLPSASVVRHWSASSSVGAMQCLVPPSSSSPPSSSASSSSSLSLFARIQCRGLIIHLPEGVDVEREAKLFGRAAVECGAESYPYFRHEYMKPYEKRFQGRKRKDGGKSIRKVRGLVEFINYKRMHKYQ